MIRTMSTRTYPVIFASLLLACGGDADTTGSGGQGGTESSVGGSSAGGMGGTGGQGGGVELGAPIDAPESTWTWVDFDDAFCANGDTTGIGINPGTSDRAIIYLMGGGACWNNLTCYVLNSAANISSGYDEASFNGGAGVNQGPFDRTDPNNPFRADSFVFVPYCTGDVHSGATTQDYNGNATQHVGYENMNAYLKRLVPTFANLNRIVLAGGSAGGYGAAFNFVRTQQWFGATRVDLIDDSGPILPNPYLSDQREQDWRTAWDIDANLPEDCPACQDDLDAIYDYFGQNYPQNRAALISYRSDTVIPTFHSINSQQFGEALDAITPVIDQYPQFNYYIDGGSGHVLMGGSWDGNNAGGVNLITWVDDMLSDSPSWASTMD